MSPREVDGFLFVATSGVNPLIFVYYMRLDFGTIPSVLSSNILLQNSPIDSILYEQFLTVI